MDPFTTTMPLGPIYYGGPCKDDYANIAERPKKYSHLRRPGQPPFQTHEAAKLQLAAMRALTRAERRFARATRPFRLARAILVTGTWRSCAEQTKLYGEDSHRFAPPDVTGHTRGFCIDVAMDQPDLDKALAALAAVGWKRARPTDEPWHHSYGPVV